MNTNYNPEQPLVDLLPDVKHAVAEEQAADAEYDAIQAEIQARFGERLEAARQRREFARATSEAVKGQFKETAMQVWATNPAQRKFFTVDNLVTIQAKQQVATYDPAAVRAWVFANMPALLDVNFKLLEALTLKVDHIPTPLTIETVNVAAVNIERVAALADIQPAVIVEEKINGVSTPLMVKREAE